MNSAGGTQSRLRREKYRPLDAAAALASAWTLPGDPDTAVATITLAAFSKRSVEVRKQTGVLCYVEIQADIDKSRIARHKGTLRGETDLGRHDQARFDAPIRIELMRPCNTRKGCQPLAIGHHELCVELHTQRAHDGRYGLLLKRQTKDAVTVFREAVEFERSDIDCRIGRHPMSTKELPPTSFDATIKSISRVLTGRTFVYHPVYAAVRFVRVVRVFSDSGHIRVPEPLHAIEGELAAFGLAAGEKIIDRERCVSVPTGYAYEQRTVDLII